MAATLLDKAGWFGNDPNEVCCCGWTAAVILVKKVRLCDPTEARNCGCSRTSNCGNMDGPECDWCTWFRSTPFCAARINSRTEGSIPDNVGRLARFMKALPRSLGNCESIVGSWCGSGGDVVLDRRDKINGSVTDWFTVLWSWCNTERLDASVSLSCGRFIKRLMFCNCNDSICKSSMFDLGVGTLFKSVCRMYRLIVLSTSVYWALDWRGVVSCCKVDWLASRSWDDNNCGSYIWVLSIGLISRLKIFDDIS